MGQLRVRHQDQIYSKDSGYEVLFSSEPLLNTRRLTLRPPRRRDYLEWAELRTSSRTFLEPWEPEWRFNHLAVSTFWTRVRWAKRSIAKKTAYPFFMFNQHSRQLVGSIILENIRGTPSRSASLGYWIGALHADKGYMSETVPAIVEFAFTRLDLSRIEAACLPDNIPSRRVLEKSGFVCEGIAQSYLQIAGQWQDHAVYAKLRPDRSNSN